MEDFQKQFKALTETALIKHFTARPQRHTAYSISTEYPVHPILDEPLAGLRDARVSSVSEEEGELEVSLTGHHETAGQVTAKFSQFGVTVMGILAAYMFNEKQ